MPKPTIRPSGASATRPNPILAIRAWFLGRVNSRTSKGYESVETFHSFPLFDAHFFEFSPKNRFQNYAMIVLTLLGLSFVCSISLARIDVKFPYEIVQFTHRHKKSVEVLDFRVFGKDYMAIVRNSRPPIHHNFRILDGEDEEFFTDFHGTFEGQLKGIQNSKVHLTRISGGAYLGYLRVGDDLIHFEPARTYDDTVGIKDTIAYKETDIVRNTKVLSGMAAPLLPPQTRSYRQKRDNPFFEYVRNQRSQVPSLHNEKKNRCPLKIVADHRFFKIVGKGDRATTARYIMNMVAKVNELFEVVNWDEDLEDKVENRGRFYDLGFSIKELKIWDKPSELVGHYNGNDTINDGIWSSNRLLEAFTSLESSTSYCIVHLMTAQSFFDRSALGLAYVATEEVGGICSEPREFGSRIGAYNTLFTSVIGNSGKKDYPLVTREAEIVVAHEYGHSWGGVHDEINLHEKLGLNMSCIPEFRDGGKYIMNPFAQAGFDPNNNNFSPCSVHMIRKMLQRRWNKCFVVEQNSLCGNGVIEEGEECDEGALLPTSSGSSCCSRSCTLLPAALCSPLNMPCCSTKCTFHNSSHICLPRDTWQCKSTSYCSGTSGECPPPKPVQDQTVCADDGECLNGNCVPYCETLATGKKGCICEEMHLSCKRCCRGNNGTGPCLPELGAGDLADGSWCVQGYCKNSRCITEVADYAAYYLSAFQDGSVFWKMIKSNIVGIVVIISVPLWILFGYYIQEYDKRRTAALQDREAVHPANAVSLMTARIRGASPVQTEETEFF